MTTTMEDQRRRHGRLQSWLILSSLICLLLWQSSMFLMMINDTRSGSWWSSDASLTSQNSINHNLVCSKVAPSANATATMNITTLVVDSTMTTGIGHVLVHDDDPTMTLAQAIASASGWPWNDMDFTTHTSRPPTTSITAFSNNSNNNNKLSKAEAKARAKAEKTAAKEQEEARARLFPKIFCGFNKCLFASKTNPSMGYLISRTGMSFLSSTTGALSAYEMEQVLIQEFQIPPTLLAPPQVIPCVTTDMLLLLELSTHFRNGKVTNSSSLAATTTRSTASVINEDENDDQANVLVGALPNNTKLLVAQTVRLWSPPSQYLGVVFEPDTLKWKRMQNHLPGFAQEVAKEATAPAKAESKAAGIGKEKNGANTTSATTTAQLQTANITILPKLETAMERAIRVMNRFPDDLSCGFHVLLSTQGEIYHIDLGRKKNATEETCTHKRGGWSTPEIVRSHFLQLKQQIHEMIAID